MDFGAPGTAAGTPCSVAGNTIQRNIFYWHGERTAARSMIGTQVKFTADFLKPNGSDHNLFFSPDEDAATALVFPNKVNLSTWQGKTKSASTGVATCATAAGSSADLTVEKDCSEKWIHNATTNKLLSSTFPGLAINLDCDGSYGHCSAGDANTRICISKPNGGPTGVVYPPPAVDNQGWIMKGDGTVTAVKSEKCVSTRASYCGVFAVFR